MAKVAFTNIQIRNKQGSLLGMAPDTELTFPDNMPIAKWGDELAKHLKVDNCSFSYELVKALTD